MHRRWIVVFALVCGAGMGAGVALGGGVGGVVSFGGACDASAAVAVGDGHVLVADDEDNVLRLYPVGGGERPVAEFDVGSFLGVGADHPEADIEGATRVGDRVYWIASHGRNKSGKMRASLYRFFATDVVAVDGGWEVRPVGRPCETLVHELLATSVGRELGLKGATRFGEDLSKGERKRLAPKDSGLNIEALAASADGKTLYVGLRNPLYVTGDKRLAVVVALENGREVVERSEKARFGRAMKWDLGGRGVRAMEYCPRLRSYLLVAGGTGVGGEFAVYRWSGDPAAGPVLVRAIDDGGLGLSPESLVVFGGRDDVLVLSDDGAKRVKVSGPGDCVDSNEYDAGDQSCEQKSLRDGGKKRFRGFWMGK